MFKSNNGVSYEAISSYMYKLSNHPKITESISFEHYSSAKKFLSCIEDPKGEVEVEVNEGGGGVATFKVGIFRISKFYSWRSKRAISHDTNQMSETI